VDEEILGEMRGFGGSRASVGGGNEASVVDRNGNIAESGTSPGLGNAITGNVHAGRAANRRVTGVVDSK
jgi:hypothetical protein